MDRTITCFVRRATAVFLAIWFVVVCQNPSKAFSQTLPFYIGTYTNGISEGVYLSALNPSTGELAQPQLVAKITNPSFLAVHPDGKRLFVVSEVTADGRAPQQVFAYEIDSAGKLTKIASTGSYGDGPCYIATSHSGQTLLVANYGSGSIASYHLNPKNADLRNVACVMQHSGGSVNLTRQEGPHAHCIVPTPDDRFVCAVDLGLDKVFVYAHDSVTGRLILHDASFSVAPGSGPRHIAFHPAGKHAFVINELASTVSSCTWDSSTGTLREVHQLSSLPDGYTSSNSTADIHVHPNGKFVYGSNRGHNSIAIFGFDSATGRLQALGHTSTEGKTPRNFCIDPTGKYLLVENQNSDSIVLFQIDSASGTLRKTGESIAVGAPVCIAFLPKKK